MRPKCRPRPRSHAPCARFCCELEVDSPARRAPRARADPLAVATQTPRFSWELPEGLARGVGQKSYSITVVMPYTDFGPVWSSGVVESDATHGIVCNKTLQANALYDVANGVVLPFDPDGAAAAGAGAAGACRARWRRLGRSIRRWFFEPVARRFRRARLRALGDARSRRYMAFLAKGKRRRGNQNAPPPTPTERCDVVAVV